MSLRSNLGTSKKERYHLRLEKKLFLMKNSWCAMGIMPWSLRLARSFQFADRSSFSAPNEEQYTLKLGELGKAGEDKYIY